MSDYPEAFLRFVRSVKNKRAKIVIDHILEYGFITTQDLETIYGYNHPPRAARDVREQGIPLVTFRVKSSDGRTIAAYKFGDISDVRFGRSEGRRTFAKTFKGLLFENHEGRCAICAGQFEERYLQIDHRVPYEIAGDDDYLNRNLEDYMLLCSVCNRAKSWSCEHCPNWQEKNIEVCKSCYWFSPFAYFHLATRQERRTALHWSEEELPFYNQLRDEAQSNQVELPDYIKILLKRFKKQ
jgi:hypothetical protein